MIIYCVHDVVCFAATKSNRQPINQFFFFFFFFNSICRVVSPTIVDLCVFLLSRVWTVFAVARQPAGTVQTQLSVNSMHLYLCSSPHIYLMCGGGEFGSVDHVLTENNPPMNSVRYTSVSECRNSEAYGLSSAVVNMFPCVGRCASNLPSFMVLSMTFSQPDYKLCVRIDGRI